MSSSQEKAARKKVIKQLRRSTAEKNARAEAKANADDNGKKHNQDEMTKSASDSNLSGLAMPHVSESKATIDKEKQLLKKPYSSNGRSPQPQPPVTRRRPSLPVSKQEPKNCRRQPRHEDRFWETKPAQGPARLGPISRLVSPPPRSNVFAGLAAKICKPLANKDSNSRTIQNVGITKVNIEKAGAPELVVSSLKKQRLEGDSGSLSASSHGKRRVGGDHDRGPTMKKSKLYHAGPVEPAEHNGSHVQGMVGQERVERSTPQKFETLLQRLDSHSGPQRPQRKRKTEDEEILQPHPKRRAVFHGTGLGAVDDGYMKPPIQRRKLGLRPRGLYNHKGACFMNAAAQALHSVKDIATMDEAKTLRDLFPSRLGQWAPEVLQKARKGHNRKRTVATLVEYLVAKAASQQLKIRPYWVNLMRQMSSHREDQVFNPVLFQQVSGALFTGAEGPMNGEMQEDVYDFMQKLLPEIDASNLFEAVFDCKKSCRKCGKEKSASVTRAELLLQIPETMKRPENKVEFEHILGNCLKDHSIFEFGKLECDGCKEIGQWDDAEGWKGQKGNRLSIAPKYLFVHIPRCDYTTIGTGRKNKDGGVIMVARMTKLRSQVVLPTGSIRVPFKDGGNANYELVAAIEHRGKNFQSGHFVTTRNVDGNWFTCNDEEVTMIKRRELQHCSQAIVCLFKKVAT